MEPASLKRAAAIGAIAVSALVAALVWRSRLAPPRSELPDERPRAIVPTGTRIRVEVINATRTRGLARRATFYLRDVGFDVVRFTTDTAQRASTLVIDRSAHPEWAKLVARALGGAPIEAHADSSRYLDVTVLLGGDWRAPAKPLYP